MNPGTLKHRIEIQDYDDGENEAKEQIKIWKLYKKLWASIRVIGNGRDEVKAGKDQFRLTYEIVTRYTPEITSGMRVVYKEKKFNINHVINYKELNIETHLICTVIEEGVYNE